MLRQCLGWVLTVALLVSFSPPPARAQGGRAELSGTITDAGKAVLPGVSITASNEATGLERTTLTDGAGRYAIPSLLPGTYTIRAELSGFQPMRRTGVVSATWAIASRTALTLQESS